MTVKLTFFEYHCHDGNCRSDMTTDGLHIKYALWLPDGGTPMFNYKSDALKYAEARGLTVVE